MMAILCDAIKHNETNENNSNGVFNCIVYASFLEVLDNLFKIDLTAQEI